MQGSPRERREIILAYIDRARRRADAAEGGKDHSMNQDFCGGREERPASAAKAEVCRASETQA